MEADYEANPNKWLDACAKVTIPEFLQYLMEDFLTFVGPLCKDNSHAHIADVVNEAYKSQLKVNHQLGKGIAKELHTVETITDKGFQVVT